MQKKVGVSYPFPTFVSVLPPPAGAQSHRCTVKSGYLGASGFRWWLRSRQTSPLGSHNTFRGTEHISPLKMNEPKSPPPSQLMTHL